MKKKVWQVVWGLKDGGAEILAREYAKLVDAQDFEPTIVTMYPFTNTANYQQAKASGLRILSIFKRRNAVTRAVRVLLGGWCVPLMLKTLIRKHKPDAIHFNSPMAHYFVPIRKGLAGVRLLYTCHSEVSNHFFEKEESAVRQLIQDNDLQLIALHDDMKNELNQCFSVNNTVVIRNGVDLQRFREVTLNKEEKRESVGVPNNGYVVGHIGRFSKAKNHPFLLRVFEKILEKKPNAHLLLVGNGELQDEIKQEIEQAGIEAR